MKSLNLARPQVLVVVGLPGAGKSFFARKFSETFSAPLVATDRIRYELFATPVHSSDENELVARMANYQIEELLKSRRSFIVDGSFNTRADRVRLGQLAKKADYDTYVIWVQTDASTCRVRALKRSSKRDDDTFNVSLTEQQFDGMAKRFTEPAREKHVVISGKHTYSAQVKTVLRRLVVAREAEADAAHREGVEQAKHASRPSSGGAHRRGIVIR